MQEQRRERFNPRHPTRRSELRGFCHTPGRRSVDTRSEQPRNYRNGHRTASLLHAEELHWVQRGHETSSLWGKFRLKLKKLIRCEKKRGLRHRKTKLRRSQSKSKRGRTQTELHTGSNLQNKTDIKAKQKPIQTNTDFIIK